MEISFEEGELKRGRAKLRFVARFSCFALWKKRAGKERRSKRRNENEKLPRKKKKVLENGAFTSLLVRFSVVLRMRYHTKAYK